MTTTSTNRDSIRPGVAPWRGVWTAMLAWAAVWALVCRGEDDRPVDDVLPLQVQERENRIDLGAQFEAQLFQRHGGRGTGPRIRVNQAGPAPASADDPSDSPTTAHLRGRAEARLSRLERDCALSAEQRRKLRLAMESDIRRLADEIDAARMKYVGQEVNLNEQAGQRQWQQLHADMQRCQALMQSLGDADSLFRKVLPTVLLPDQEARLKAETDARRRSLWKAMTAAVLVKNDDAMGLDEKQYADLEKLLLEHQPPLRLEAFIGGENQNDNLHMTQMLVWMAYAEIDPQRLRAGLSDRQAALIAQHAAQGKAMRSHIEAQGFLEKVSP